MSFIGAVTNAAKTVVQTVTSQAPNPPAPPTSAPPPPPVRDVFERMPQPKVELRADGNGQVSVGKTTLASFSVGFGGVKLTSGGNTLESTSRNGLGGSTHVHGTKVGVHFKGNDGPATLGAISVVVKDTEVSLGMVPAAPSPLPMIAYAGKDRTEG